MRRRRPPTRPGEILHEEFLLPLGMTQKQLADHVGCDVKVINRIVNGRTSVTAEMALKLAAALQTPRNSGSIHRKPWTSTTPRPGSGNSPSPSKMCECSRSYRHVRADPKSGLRPPIAPVPQLPSSPAPGSPAALGWQSPILVRAHFRHGLLACFSHHVARRSA